MAAKARQDYAERSGSKIRKASEYAETSNDLYSYLGHFRQDKNIDMGHNFFGSIAGEDPLGQSNSAALTASSMMTPERPMVMPTPAPVAAPVAPVVAPAAPMQKPWERKNMSIQDWIRAPQSKRVRALRAQQARRYSSTPIGELFGSQSGEEAGGPFDSPSSFNESGFIT